MFGVSVTEIAMIAIVALVIVGPHKLPGMLRTLGQSIRKLRLFTTEMRAQTGIDEILREEGIQGGLTELRSLLHGDLHTGSVFADENQTKVFDAEFAFVGPMAFDSGLLLGNILINYVSWSGKDEPADAVRDYRAYLRETIEDIWRLFEERFRDNWQRDAREIIAGIPGLQDDFIRELFVDMIGFAAVVMIRRMHGLAHNVDVDEIEDLERRKQVQVLVLELAEELMIGRDRFTDIRQVTEAARQFIAGK